MLHQPEAIGNCEDYTRGSGDIRADALPVQEENSSHNRIIALLFPDAISGRLPFEVSHQVWDWAKTVKIEGVK